MASEWIVTWTWNVGANSKVGVAYRKDAPTDIRLCGHRHRSSEQAEQCARLLVKP